MPCNIGSINQIHKRLNENGYAISKRLLRQLVADGVLPAISSGNRLLINYDSVVKLLLTQTAIPNQALSPA